MTGNFNVQKMPGSDANPFVEGDRTKYKAAARYMHQVVFSGLHKEVEELPEERVAALAKTLEAGKLTPTRPDRRFPNKNQVNQCWTALNEYQLCVEKRSKEDLLCLQRARDYQGTCPQKWIDEWKDHAERGINMSVGKEFVR